MTPKSIHIIVAVIAFLTLGTNILAQTWTAIMSGENSEAFTFVNNNSSPRSTVTSIQSPFAFPGNATGSTDTQQFPTGNGSATPPWWFRYTSGSGSIYASRRHWCQHPTEFAQHWPDKFPKIVRNRHSS